MKKLICVLLTVLLYSQTISQDNITFSNVNVLLQQTKFNKNLLNNYFAPASKSSDWILIEENTDHLGISHKKYVLSYKNIPIDKAFLTAHISPESEVRITGKIANFKVVNNAITITEPEALKIALTEINAELYEWEDPLYIQHLHSVSKEYFKDIKPTAELLFINIDGTLELCYKFTIRAISPLSADDIYISTYNGTVIKQTNLIHDINVTGTAHTKYSGTQTIVTDSISPNDFILRDYSRGGGVHTFDLNTSTNASSAIDFRDCL